MYHISSWVPKFCVSISTKQTRLSGFDKQKVTLFQKKKSVLNIFRAEVCSTHDSTDMVERNPIFVAN